LVEEFEVVRPACHRLAIPALEERLASKHRHGSIRPGLKSGLATRANVHFEQADSIILKNAETFSGKP
jgi:hypothetical protein